MIYKYFKNIISKMFYQLSFLIETLKNQDQNQMYFRTCLFFHKIIKQVQPLLRGLITFEPPKIVSFLRFIFRQITKRKAIKMYRLY